MLSDSCFVEWMYQGGIFFFPYWSVLVNDSHPVAWCRWIILVLVCGVSVNDSCPVTWWVRKWLLSCNMVCQQMILAPPPHYVMSKSVPHSLTWCISEWFMSCRVICWWNIFVMSRDALVNDTYPLLQCVLEWLCLTAWFINDRFFFWIFFLLLVCRWLISSSVSKYLHYCLSAQKTNSIVNFSPHELWSS